jgi:hypothetical protein
MSNQKSRSLGGLITTPLSVHGVPSFLVYLFAVIGGLYLLNPTGGMIELLPDNLPLIGNLDEGGAALALWYGVLEMVQKKRGDG